MDIRLFTILFFISSVSILVTYLLNVAFKKKRYIKYFPAIIMFLFMIYNFIAMNSDSSEGFQSLGRFIMGLFFLTACVSSLIFSIVADIFYKRRKLK